MLQVQNKRVPLTIKSVLLYSLPNFDKTPTSFDYETTNGRHREVSITTVLAHLCQET